ncbi:MAG: V-type ATP synthase subunit E [Oscillospiraceae bacterium]
MDAFEQLEMQREASFRDAVMDAAKAQSEAIVQKARAEAEAALRAARQQGAAARPESDDERRAEALREHSTALLKAKQEVLAARQRLVDGLFAEVRQRLSDFAASDAYPPWLAQKLAARAAQAQDGQPVEVFVRPADMAHAALLQKALPGCTVRPNADIALGGARVQSGRLLYDDTLDAALQAEREAFTRTSGLSL